MNDELLKKEKYLCVIVGGLEGLAIADLFIRMNDGKIMKQVVVRQGDYVPTDLIDFDDIKKSRLAGSLGKCIARGWIIVENPAIEVPKLVVKEPVMMKPTKSSAITEIDAGIISPAEVSNRVAEATQIKQAVNPFPTERELPVKSIISDEQSRTVNAFAITEKSVTSDGYFVFNKLKHFQKLKTIKDTKDVGLLERIVNESNYPQLVHNAKLRLQELAVK